MPDLSNNDIRGAVAAGIITEVQATEIITASHARMGFREQMGDEDEPFELFKGFSEIFVTVGLALLTAGIAGASVMLGNPLFMPIVAAVLSVIFARYFTIRRRMTLPSIFLAGTFGVSVAALSAILLFEPTSQIAWRTLAIYAISAAALLGYFRFFRVPFIMFLVGLCGVGAAYSITGIFLPEQLLVEGLQSGPQRYLDLGRSPTLAMTLLAFGVVAFIGAMSFDIRDPHRISRYSASAFWLHILAAPAIVNVVSVSLLGIGGVAGYVLATIALLIITCAALIIDRRSFLTAGIIYIGVILTWAISSTDISGTWGVILTLFIMGAFITWLGAWWVQMRGRLMRVLPQFPYKDRLPPYPKLETS
jgi:MFS family permease